MRPEDDGGSIIPNAVIGFDPASGEDRTVVLERWQEELLKKTAGSTIYSLAAGRGIGKTAAAAALAATSPWVTAIRGAEAKCPWPYGTVIKPTLTSPIFPEEARHMVVGSSSPGTISTLDLAPGIEDSARPYAHLLEDIEERWEVAEEAP